MSAVNPIVGSITCAWCGNDCEVKESRKNKLYYVCSASSKNEGCGQFMMAYKGGQKLMNEKTVFTKPDLEAKNLTSIEKDVKKITSNDDELVPKPKPAKKEKSFFDFD